MTHFRIRQGGAGDLASEPLQQIDDGPWPIRVGIVGADYPGLRPAFEVSEGDRVKAGQVLFTDRKHKQIAFVAPIGGTVVETAFGARRTLARVVIQGDATSDQDTNDQPEAAPPDAGSDDSARKALQARGLWSAFRTRPFGLVPTPDARPDAIFVNAVRAGAQKPDPVVVLERRLDDFRRGLEVLTKLTTGDVHLCQDQGARLCPNTPSGVRVSQFSGSRAAALSGAHIHRLHPVGDDARVWTIGYQDVAAIGMLFGTGRHDGSRVVALSGARAARPRLIRVPLGADIRALTEGEATQMRRGPDARVLSGGAVAGRPAAFLGRHHDEVAIVAAQRPSIGWRGEPATGRRALIPSAGLDRALPFDIMAVPLMRALAVGDTEAAHRLGCLELIEEDVALLTRRCTSGADYGSLLRDILDEIAKDAA